MIDIKHFAVRNDTICYIGNGYAYYISRSKDASGYVLKAFSADIAGLFDDPRYCAVFESLASAVAEIERIESTCV